MIDAERLLGSLVRNAMTGDSRGRSRSRRRRHRGRRRGSSLLGGAGKGALAVGALGVAMAAYEHFAKKQSSKTQATASSVPPPPLPPGVPAAAAPPPPPPPPPPATPPSAPASDVSESEALLLVRAMIAAANADHEIDDEERGRILQALEEAEGSDEDEAFLLDELESPVDLGTLASLASTPELAEQVYLVSCLAIEIDTRAERKYLDRLAARLGVEPERAAELEAEMAADPPTAE